MKDVMIGIIKNLKTMYDIQVWYLHCDNAGENVDFERVCRQEGIGIEFEYTTSGILQQYGCVE